MPKRRYRSPALLVRRLLVASLWLWTAIWFGLVIVGTTSVALAQTPNILITFDPDPLGIGMAGVVSFQYTPSSPSVRYLNATIPSGCSATGWSQGENNIFGRDTGRFSPPNRVITATVTCDEMRTYTFTARYFSLNGRNPTDLESRSVDVQVSVPPTATPTFPPTPTPTPTPGPIMLRARMEVTNLADTGSAPVYLPLSIDSILDANLAGTSGDRLLVCPGPARCWTDLSTLYPSAADGPVPQKLSGDEYSVYVPDIDVQEHVDYTLYVSRTALSRPALSGTIADATASEYRVDFSGWVTYQSPVHELASGPANFVGPVDTAGFAVVRDLPAPDSGIPGSTFLSRIAGDSGIPLRWYYVMLTFPIAIIAIVVVQRVFDNIVYSVCAGGFILVALCSPALGFATAWVVIFYAVVCACVVVIGRRLSAGI